VDTWQKPGEMQARPGQIIPPLLFLPDGRIVPTCVVCAQIRPIADRPISEQELTPYMLGGGYPVLSTVQEQLRVGSVGALVTDGHSIYALTNRHVAGPAGQVSSVMGLGELHRVGEAAAESVRHRPFSRVYPDWPPTGGLLNLDAGLIRVDQTEDWSAQVYGLGTVGRLADFHSGNLSLDLIDRPVRAFGGTSGPLRGAIKGLFYRYQSLAGTDYMTDYLVGPRAGENSVPTRHGDSGTLWFLDDPDPGAEPGEVRSFRPFAMQWGGTSFVDDTDQETSQFALASNLATVLQELGVELIHDWNTSPSETWGKMGHYQIGASACDVVAAPKLRQLLEANRDNIGLTDGERENKTFPTGKSSFIALADVPDLWWKNNAVRGAHEKPNHFADMDQEGTGAFAGQTLMSLYEKDPGSLTTDTWRQFYQSIDVTRSKMGSLPFRVRQIYEAMVQYVHDRKVSEYVAAAGILAHYVGDAAQPLHASRLHDGSGAAQEKGVHSQYETKMMDRFRKEIVAGVAGALANVQIASRFQGAQRAAEATVELMQYAASVMSPQRIIDVYVAARQTSNVNDALWAALGKDTIDVVAESAMYLAEIWESAWLEGGGENIGWNHMVAVPHATLVKLYKSKTFLPSNYLEDM